MKKFLCMVLALMMALAAIPAAAECGCGECAECACNAGQIDVAGVLRARGESAAAAGVYSGASWWALAENQLVVGIKSLEELGSVLPMQTAGKPYIRGNVDNGLIREKGMLRAVIGGVACGLTKVDIAVRIKTEYISLVESIVARRLEGVDMSANSVIACSQWWAGETVGHIFFTASAARIAVGVVSVNGGQDVIQLYAGDFDGDGAPELGFAAGWMVKEPPKAPEQRPGKECTPCNRKPCGKGGGGICVQINIFSIVKNVFSRMCQ